VAQLVEQQMFKQLQDEAELETIQILLEDLFLLPQQLVEDKVELLMKQDLQEVQAVALVEATQPLNQVVQELQAKDLLELQDKVEDILAHQEVAVALVEQETPLQEEIQELEELEHLHTLLGV
jgi:hypothetical protein